MAVQLTLSADFGFVMLAIFSTFLTNMFLVFSVIKARKDFGVVYPALYAPPGHKHEDKFNCIQRAHQNYLETWSQVIILTLINGFFNPKLSAVFCFIFAVGRCIYGVGYQTYGPKGRNIGGVIAHLGDIPLMLMLPYTAYSLITGEI